MEVIQHWKDIRIYTMIYTRYLVNWWYMSDIVPQKRLSNILLINFPLYGVLYWTLCWCHSHCGRQQLHQTIGRRWGGDLKLNCPSTSSRFDVKLRNLLQAKHSVDVLELMEKYKAYKTNYMKNMTFDPQAPGLSMLLLMANPNHHVPRLHHTQCSLSSDPDLLWHCDIWRNTERREGDNQRPAGSDWWHHGTPYRLLHPQRCGDHLLPRQILHVPQAH